jgi:hypothetical protein
MHQLGCLLHWRAHNEYSRVVLSKLGAASEALQGFRRLNSAAAPDFVLLRGSAPRAFTELCHSAPLHTAQAGEEGHRGECVITYAHQSCVIAAGPAWDSVLRA